MSYYINGHAVLNVIKTRLDADSTLDGLLGVRSGKSKVILGVARPDMANLPCVHLSILTRTIDPETKLNRLLVRVAWFVNALTTSRQEDIEALAQIGECIYDLLDDWMPTISGYRVDVFVVESGEGVGRDILRPEGFDNDFDSLIFAVNIRRIL